LYDPNTFLGKSLTPQQGLTRLKILENQRIIFAKHGTPFSEEDLREYQELSKLFHSKEVRVLFSVTITRGIFPSSTRLSNIVLIIIQTWIRSVENKMYHIAFNEDTDMLKAKLLQRSAQLIDIYEAPIMSTLLSSERMAWYQTAMLDRCCSLQNADLSNFLEHVYRSHINLLINLTNHNVDKRIAENIFTLIILSLTTLLECQMAFYGFCETRLLLEAKNTAQSLIQLKENLLASESLSERGVNLNSCNKTIDKELKNSQYMCKETKDYHVKYLKKIAVLRSSIDTCRKEINSMQMPPQQTSIAFISISELINLIPLLTSIVESNLNSIHKGVNISLLQINNIEEVFNYLEPCQNKIIEMLALWVRTHRNFNIIGKIHRDLSFFTKKGSEITTKPIPDKDRFIEEMQKLLRDSKKTLPTMQVSCTDYPSLIVSASKFFYKHSRVRWDDLHPETHVSYSVLEEPSSGGCTIL